MPSEACIVMTRQALGCYADNLLEEASAEEFTIRGGGFTLVRSTGQVESVFSECCARR